MHNFKFGKGIIPYVTLDDEPYIERQVQLGRNLYEPIFENRFLVEFQNTNLNISEQISNLNLPGATIENGVMFWNDINLTLNYNVNSPFIHELLEYLSHKIDKNFRIKLLGPAGDVVSVWNINGFIREYKFGDLSYESDEPLKIEISIAVNDAVLEF